VVLIEPPFSTVMVPAPCAPSSSTPLIARDAPAPVTVSVPLPRRPPADLAEAAAGQADRAARLDAEQAGSAVASRIGIGAEGKRSRGQRPATLHVDRAGAAVCPDR